MILYGLLFSLIGAAITGGYGYYKGYQICNQAQQIRLLQAEVKRLELSKKYLESSLAAAKEIVDANSETIKGNQTLIDSLNNDIENERTNSKTIAANCIIDGAFLQRTDNIK